MSLDTIISVQIDRTTTTPTQTGFGTPLIAGYFPTSIFPERVKSYVSLVEMTGDGFEAGDPVYTAASDCWAQNPSPPIIKIGRRALAPQQISEVTPTELEVGSVHTVTIVGYEDSAFGARAVVTDTASYTVVTSDTATDICDGLRTDLTPTGDYTEGGTATLLISADNTTMDGMLFGVTYTVNGDAAGVDDNTTDAGIATDLAAIELYDPDWYGLCLDSNGALEIVAAADWVESNDSPKQFVCQTQDPAVASEPDGTDDPVTGSVAAQLKGSTTERTMLFYHRNNRQYVCAAMLGRALPEDAGSITWAYKQLSSVTAQSLTTTELANIEAKNANSITTMAGVSITRFGTASSGEYMDVLRGSDWLEARIKERVYALLLQNDKVPYTDGGIQAVRSEILAQLQAGVARDFIAADPEPTCSVPRASEVSAALKAARSLEDVTFRATLAGAVHKVNIEGQLSL